MIRKAITWALLGLVSGAFSTVCDATYEAQRMHILILEGPDRDQLSVKSHTEYNSTSNTADGIDFDQLPAFGKAYDTILTKYESTCNQEGHKPVRMATRDSTEDFEFSNEQLWTRFASQVNFGSVGTLHNVFLTKQDSGGLARDIIIKDSVSGDITTIYGAYHMVDTLKDENGQTKGTRTTFLGLQSVVDTTNFYDLHNATLTLPLDGPNDIRNLTVHFLTVYYDSTEVTSVKETAAFASPFQVNYSGGKVYIKVSPQADPVSSIQLYSLTGKRIREIFPTGNTFVWDGASERGIPMPRGLYLMEADGQFVGKVMYTQTSR